MRYISEMNTTFPPIAEVRASLEALGHAGVQKLARVSGVPFTTLWKIRTGITKNPGIETVRQFVPYIHEVAK